MAINLKDIPVSVLDLAGIVQGDRSAGDAFKRSLAFAQHAEQLGYKRYWFAEHHNMESVASSATSVLIGHIAQGTSSIRVGSGGIMLPNHAPLIIAEQFGTLESLYPGRIDLGLGRAPGTDQATAYALRRNLNGDVDSFPNDVAELLQYFGSPDKQGKVKAIPGVGTHVPVWLLGSSTFSAQLAAKLGLPFAFASHFAPAQLFPALQLYHTNFQPSQYLDKPYAMACVNIIAAETDEEAEFLASSFQQLVLGMVRNNRKPLPPPVADMERRWSLEEHAAVKQMLYYSFVGSLDTLQTELTSFVENTHVNELMVATHIYDFDKKKSSLERTASLFKTEVVEI
ncbi:LLM class flavin-dependent oxidoreductase [Pseudochryseolinea flava]|uniref:Luciferase-like monooxygenase n=1 Tax=Pseudochryseolinea flava TaxID=2059302 RepID=A0A364XWA1_9BACT|nr:LLM class flavin-dependent oxidoreductase [Pseudochryseolinea flava]RAV98459.1 LLM class flavin-dependent oxidoreductase [Pseudochryseolinea flava]